MTTTADIKIHEDNSGAVYLTGLGSWHLGPVTPDLEGKAAELAGQLHSGEWTPSEEDGQTPVDPEHVASTCDLIGTWTVDDGIEIGRDEYGRPIAGAGGARFLGLDD